MEARRSTIGAFIREAALGSTIGLRRAESMPGIAILPLLRYGAQR